MSTEKAYARCKACDRGFFPAWRKDVKQYEDLCWNCMKVSQWTARVDPILYGAPDSVNIHPDKWEQSSAEDVADYLRDLTVFDSIEDNLLEMDEYTAGTGYDSGEWFGDNNPFDTYEV